MALRGLSHIGKKPEFPPQQEPITIIYKGRQIILDPKDTGQEFGDKIVATTQDADDIVSILAGLARVTVPAGQYIVGKLREIDQEKKRG
jgi:hypothetical protein